jgi:hypothetical protein
MAVPPTRKKIYLFAQDFPCGRNVARGVSEYHLRMARRLRKKRKIKKSREGE